MHTGPNNTPKLPTQKPSSKSSARARLSAAGDWWNRAWEEDGVLHGRGVPTGSMSGFWSMLMHLSR
ncbi:MULTISPECIES: hypothetical protein [unclassified Streptomyces]|uniref:hypothetical protein n=1 Tax=unclassified Streptomyces TaxID=2593676 RepID=UPI000A5C45F0|nr:MULTISPECIES: hypothetical protein [unclassified Streptomyces]